MSNLERWRKEQKLTYAGMAIRLDEHVSSVFAWCVQGRKPHPSRWKKIARITKLNYAQIVGIA
jgi:hypothetical protein